MAQFLEVRKCSGCFSPELGCVPGDCVTTPDRNSQVAQKLQNIPIMLFPLEGSDGCERPSLSRQSIFHREVLASGSLERRWKRRSAARRRRRPASGNQSRRKTCLSGLRVRSAQKSDSSRGSTHATTQRRCCLGKTRSASFALRDPLWKSSSS